MQVRTQVAQKRMDGPDLFELMDSRGRGIINLENMRSLYERLPVLYRQTVREVFQNYILTEQSFDITHQQFTQRFRELATVRRSNTPCVRVSLHEYKENLATEHIDHNELKQIFERRKGLTAVKPRKPKFIRKNGSRVESPSFFLDFSTNLL